MEFLVGLSKFGTRIADIQGNIIKNFAITVRHEEKYSNKYFIFIKIAFLSGKKQVAIVIHRQEYQLFKSKRK